MHENIREHLKIIHKMASQHFPLMCEIADYLKPLGVHSLNYEIFHHGVRVFVLESNQDYLIDYLEKFDSFQNSDFLENRIALLNQEIIYPTTDPLLSDSNPIADIMKVHLENSIALSYQSGMPEEIELFTFSGFGDLNEWTNMQMQNLASLKQFMIYFKSQTFHLVQQKLADMKQTGLYKSLPHRTKNPHKKIINFPIKQYYLEGPFKHHFLTPKEMHCLKYYFYGFSSKEIGKKLEVSHRTVEKHLENIRLKTSCTHMSELRHQLLLSNSFLHFLSSEMPL